MPSLPRASSASTTACPLAAAASVALVLTVAAWREAPAASTPATPTASADHPLHRCHEPRAPGRAVARLALLLDRGRAVPNDLVAPSPEPGTSLGLDWGVVGGVTRAS